MKVFGYLAIKLDEQLIYNREQKWGAGASLLDASRGLEIYPFPCMCMYVLACALTLRNAAT